MIRFLLVFFGIYGSAHLYLLARVRRGYDLGRPATIMLCLGLALMAAAPILVHQAERAGFDRLARLVALGGYLWMGLLFVFVVVALLLDLYGLAVISVARLCGREWAFLLPGRRLLLLLPLLAAVTVVGCGWFEARAIRLERVVLATDKLPPGTDTLRVVQLSDVHLGLLVGEQRLAAILEQVRRAEPDLLVATGDLVDGQVDDLAGLAGQLREIRPRFGKYAIVGNHEFYAGLEYALGFLREGGFTVLRNEARIVAPGLVVAGVDDRRAATWVSAEGSGEEELLSGLPSRRFVLFLKHRPQVEPTSIGRFDLQLSGHVHQGQIFPFGLMTRLFFPVEVGVLQPLAHGFLYVNRGAGTWGPPIRFLAPPAVTLIELRAAPAAAR